MGGSPCVEHGLLLACQQRQRTFSRGKHWHGHETTWCTRVLDRGGQQHDTGKVFFLLLCLLAQVFAESRNLVLGLICSFAEGIRAFD